MVMSLRKAMQAAHCSHIAIAISKDESLRVYYHLWVSNAPRTRSIELTSGSRRRRVTRGIKPRRAVEDKESPIVSIQPDQGGSVHIIVDEPWSLPWESEGDDMDASYYIART